MAVTPSPSKSSTELLKELKKTFKGISYVPGDSFVWSATENTVYYPARSHRQTFPYSLLHETGHALLGHNSFKSDIDLIKIERDAWDKANEIAPQFGINIPTDFIERCMDTYRDWLYARSLCPHCKQCGIQTDYTQYSCVFCRHHWIVSKSRLCRVTRRGLTKTIP